MRHNKGTILKASVDYIKKLRKDSDKMRQLSDRERQLESVNRKMALRIQVRNIQSYGALLGGK